MSNSLKPDQQLLHDAAAESAFSPQQWESAFEAVRQWMATHGKEARFEDIVAYIGCCASVQAGAPAYVDLAEVTREFLDSYGFENASKSKHE